MVARPSRRGPCRRASEAAAPWVRGSRGKKEAKRSGSCSLRGEPHLRGELPEDRTELGAKLEQAAGEEVGERGLDVAQLVHVGDQARSLDGEDEVLRRGGGPLVEAGGALQGVEGAVDLHAGKAGGGKLKLAALRELRRVEDAAPARVAPAGDPDADSSDRNECGRRCFAGHVGFGCGFGGSARVRFRFKSRFGHGVLPIC